MFQPFRFSVVPAIAMASCTWDTSDDEKKFEGIYTKGMETEEGGQKLHEKDKQLENLKSTLDESTKLMDNEIKLVSTAFYEIGLELQQRWRAPPQPRSWLGVQRRRLQQERAPFGA